MKFHSALIALVVFSAQVNSLPIRTTQHRFKWSPSARLIDQTFDIDLPTPARIHVTDPNLSSEGFSVYDNGLFVGETTFSHHGYFSLDQGHHLITIRLKDTSPKHGSVVPEKSLDDENIIVYKGLPLELVTEEFEETVAESSEENIIEDEEFYEEIIIGNPDNFEMNENGLQGTSNSDEVFGIEEFTNDTTVTNESTETILDFDNAVIDEGYAEYQDSKEDDIDEEEEDEEGCDEDEDENEGEYNEKDEDEDTDESDEEDIEIKKDNSGGEEYIFCTYQKGYMNNKGNYNDDEDFLHTIPEDEQDAPYTITSTSTVIVNVYGTQTIVEMGFAAVE